MKNWKFGIVGAGLIADFHAKAIQNLENASLIGICGSNPDKARRLAEKYNCRIFENLEELWCSDDIEIVVIATPSGAHLEPTIAALMNQAIHMIDLLQHLMGPVDSLQSYTATLGHSIEAEDTGVAVLKFKNNALGVIYGSTASFPGQFRRIEITGTKGTVIQVENSFKVWQFADQTEADNEIFNRFNQIEGGGGVSDPGAIPFEPNAKNISAFIDSIEFGKTFEINGQESRKAVEIVLAIYTSALEQRPYIF